MIDERDYFGFDSGSLGDLAAGGDFGVSPASMMPFEFAMASLTETMTHLRLQTVSS